MRVFGWIRSPLKKDVKKVDEVLKHLKGLRETWQKAINIANQEKLKNADNSLIDEDADSYDADEEEDEEE